MTTISLASVLAIVVVILALCVILVVAFLVVRNCRRVFVPNNDNTFQNLDGLTMKNDAYVTTNEEMKPLP